MMKYYIPVHCTHAITYLRRTRIMGDGSSPHIRGDERDSVYL